MDLVIKDGVVSPEAKVEIRWVIHRISAGQNEHAWTLPARMHLVRRLHGGRSSSEVYEAHVGPGKMVVLKLGPASELRDEYSNYQKYLTRKNQSNLFAPILAVTPGLQDHSQLTGQREAIVYAHAATYDGSRSKTQTFEEICKKAIESGNSYMDAAIRALNKLFESATSDLYSNFEVEDASTSLLNQWNLRLGIDAVIEIKEFNSTKSTFMNDNPRAARIQFWPHDIVHGASRLDGRIQPGMIVELRDLVAIWWGDRLIGEHLNAGVRGEPMRIEVVAGGN